MITDKLLQRINYLARKQRDGELTDGEKSEQHALRRQYLDAIRQQVMAAMESAGYRKKHRLRCGCPDCRPQAADPDPQTNPRV